VSTATVDDLKCLEVDPEPKQIPLNYSYRKAGCLSRITFHYCNKVIDEMKTKDGKMEEKMLESMTMNDDDTKRVLETFNRHYERRVAKMKA